MWKMRYEVGPNSCRICLQQDKKVRSIYKAHDEGDETPHDMLVQLLGIPFTKLNQTDLAPEIICKECELAVNMAYQFRERALKIQSIIEDYCKEAGVEFDEITTVEEMFIKEEEPTMHGDEVLEEEEELHEIVEEYEAHEVAGENELEYQIHKEEIDVDIEIDSNGNENENDDTPILPDDEIEYLEETFLEVDQQQEEMDSESADDFLLNHDFKTIEKKKRTVSRIKRPSDISAIKREKQNGYICDVCGNIYEKRGRMLEHRRRHDVGHHYQCELCEKRFPAREQLRKHIYSHTGSKPYKCSFCSRTFFYESVLKTHENVHRGVKPYICNVCNKAFAYSHSLTKHELIHKDIKMYHCEFCNKDFRLQHHMRQHEETKCHQNAVAQAMKQEHPDIKTESSLYGQ